MAGGLLFEDVMKHNPYHGKDGRFTSAPGGTSAIAQTSAGSTSEVAGPTKDSSGKKLSAAQSEYFKDSKVLDDKGRLKCVYHGTDSDFTEFDRGQLGSATGNPLYGDGFYFTDKKRAADNFGGRRIDAYINMKNPYYATESDAGMLRSAKLKEQGYDGIVLRVNPSESYYIAFDSNQIKTTDNRNPTDSADITKFNPYHDAHGRFSNAGNYTSFTYSPGKSKAHDLAIQREKERMAGRMPSEAQAKTLKNIESRTRNLKKEQYRVVDRDGNVVLQKQGDQHSVSYTIGEAREHIPGNITIHNHPDGGTFSSSDLSDIGHGATEIRAAAPEGTYILRNARYGARYDAAKEKTWFDMRDDIDAASLDFKTDRQLKREIRKPFDEQLKPITQKWEKRKAEGASWDELNEIAKEYTTKADSFKPEIEAAARKAYVGQYHQWYQSNAGNYGLEYEFVPVQTRTRKSDGMDETMGIIEKSTGDIVLDQKMHQDVEEMAGSIIDELKSAFPAVQKSDNNVSILKTDDDKRLVFGWASISITVDGEQLEDRQQDMIDPEDLEEAAYEYVLNFRDTGEEHIPTMRKKGKLVESCVFTEEKQRAMGIPAGTIPIGWWIGFKIEDDDAWERVKNGTYRMFSIEGKANREPVEKSDKEESEEKVAKSFHEILGISPAPERTIEKHHPDRFDHIEEVVEKSNRYDHIEEVQKYNPYHGKDGRFTSANGGGVATVVSGEGKAIITAARTSKANVDKNVAKVRGACSNEYSPIAKEPVNMAKVKERGGCDDAEAKKCVGLADQVFSKAAAAEPQITKDVVSVVGDNGGKMYGLAHRMKQPTSMAGKIAADAKEDGISVEQAAGKIKDAVRYTAVFESKGFVSGYANVKSKLESQGYEEVRCKNFFEKYENGTSCQKAVQCVYKNKSGQMFELQFHTYETQGAKEVNHKYYEEQRAVGTTQRRSKALNDAMTKISSYSEVPDGVLGIKSHG